MWVAVVTYIVGVLVGFSLAWAALDERDTDAS